MTPSLGVCYYPEHWPEEVWQDDAKRMADLGIRFVRIGEFAWSRMEPKRGQYEFDWLERAIEILHQAGLKIVLGTPTATPPKWLVNEMPDMLPVDRDGRQRGFGSRRHYSFSHQGYRKECARIVTELAKRFGEHPGISGWQTDNEYDCHNTTQSFSDIDLDAFRNWLAQKYQSPEALNKAWGNVFWSMEINSFDEIELPNLTVTEANPAHWMDYRRFASDMVAEFNLLQCAIIRKFSPGRDIIHNFMGRTLAFDHFKVGADLDISSWDSYPLGFLEDRSDEGDLWKQHFAKAGDPDFQAFHHDLYRATSGGRWWVMEQQPGPVNWAPHNPAPRDGMVRLWTLEAFAHGAETVSYFRWRQAPFAQEQMHSGLLRPDRVEAEACQEARQSIKDISAISKFDGNWPKSEKAGIALVFDYASAWAWEIQPQGREFDYFRLVFDQYRALRKLGQSVDIVSASDADLRGYKLVLIPGLFCWNQKLVDAIAASQAQVILGPRCGSKTENFAIPEKLAPNLAASLLDITISRVETLRADCPVSTGKKGQIKFWREQAVVGPKAKAEIIGDDGFAATVTQNNLTYLCGWPDAQLMQRVVKGLLKKAGLPVYDLPDGVRLRLCGNLLFAFNYGSTPFDLSTILEQKPVYGDRLLKPAGIAVFKM